MVNIGDTVYFFRFPLIYTGEVRKIEITEKGFMYYFDNDIKTRFVSKDKKECIEQAREFTTSSYNKEVEKAKEKLDERLNSLDNIF